MEKMRKPIINLFSILSIMIYGCSDKKKIDKELFVNLEYSVFNRDSLTKLQNELQTQFSVSSILAELKKSLVIIETNSEAFLRYKEIYELYPQEITFNEYLSKKLKKNRRSTFF